LTAPNKYFYVFLRVLFCSAGVRAILNRFPILCPGFSPCHFFFTNNTDLAR
jgi:hypothetical protein